MKIFRDHFLFFNLFLGLFIRLMFSSVPGFKFDVDTWFSWAQRLNEVGYMNFYSDSVWTGYPPGFLYVLSFLGLIRNILQITDAQFYILLKLPAILAEIAIALLAYRIIPAKYELWKKIALVFILFNPAFIFNSSIFGQFDGLFSLILLLTIYFLVKNKFYSASFFWGLAFLLKPQAVLILPFFLFYFLKNYSLRRVALMSLISIITVIIGFFPFFPKNFIFGPISLIINLLDYYPYTSIFAYNIWGIQGFWIKDSILFLNITYQNWGYLIFIFYLVFVSILGIKRKLSFYSIAALFSLGSFFLITRMHERYLYPSLIFLILVSSMRKSLTLLILTGILILIHFLDLYYVYIYYNQFYLKLPEILYMPDIYNFAANNIPLISLVSTLIFTMITINILFSKTEDENQF